MREDQGFFFVVDSGEIIGFVNIADLNKKIPLRILLYTLISDIEAKLREIISQKEEANPLDYLDRNARGRVNSRMRKYKDENIDVDCYEYFDFRDYITLVKKSPYIRQFLLLKRCFLLHYLLRIIVIYL